MPRGGNPRKFKIRKTLFFLIQRINVNRIFTVVPRVAGIFQKTEGRNLRVFLQKISLEF